MGLSAMPEIIPRREPSGRLQRPGAQERQNEANRRRFEQTIGFVAGQPHRRGDTSRMAESPVGRFIRDYALPRECYDAALEYARLLGMWGSIKGVPQLERHGGSGGEVSEKTVRRWGDDLKFWEGKIRDSAGDEGIVLVRKLSYFNEELAPRDDRQRAICALMALARAQGRA